MRSIVWTLGAVAILATAPPLGATTYLVLPDGSRDFPTIQAAIDAAADGDVIELGDGTFRGSGNRFIELAKGLTIRSASGDPEGCIIDCEGEYSSPARGLTVYGPIMPLVQGISIVHGYIEDSGGAGGILCLSAATFVDCVMSDNLTPGRGGGVGCFQCAPTFVRCRFERNVSGQRGGGVDVSGGAPRFERCIFWENTASAGGGGCSVVSAAAEFSECIFQGNSAPCGGGVSCSQEPTTRLGRGGAFGSQESVARLDRCTIMDNSASLAGSGLCVGELSTLDLNNTIVAFNHGGQAVCCWLGTGGSATLICCDVFGNEGGDWVDCIEDQAGVEGNICLDPFFCGFDEGDYRLRSDSPCAPDFNPECGLIGALPVGCGGSPTFETSWGAMKALFRGDAK